MAKTTIKRLATQVRGVSYKPEDLYDSPNANAVILLRANNIDDGKINFEDVVYVDKNKVSKNQYLQPHDVLICASSGSKQLVGKAASVDFDFPCTFGAFCKVVRPNVGMERYLGAYFQSSIYRRKISELALGANINNIRNEHIDNLELPNYNDGVANTIAEKITLIQKIINNKKAILRELDVLIKARFVEMFGDPVTNPHGYFVQTLQQLIDSGVITYHLDGNHGGDYPRSEEFVDSGVPYIGANCIVNGNIDFSMAKFLTEERAEKLRKGIAQNEDVLFAHNATVGPTVVLHTDLPKVILSTSLTAYRCNQDKIKPNYLKSYMQSDGFIRQYSGEMKQTTRNQVPITAQKKYLFLVPPLEEQNQFASFVAQVDKSKVAIQKSLDETQLLFDSLMQKYFG